MRSSIALALSCASEETPKLATIASAWPRYATWAFCSCSCTRRARLMTSAAPAPVVITMNVVSAARPIESSARRLPLTSFAMRASSWSATSLPAFCATSA